MLLAIRKGAANRATGTTYSSIRRGLTEAIAHAGGKAKGVKVYAPKHVDVAALRQGIGRRFNNGAEFRPS